MVDHPVAGGGFLSWRNGARGQRTLFAVGDEKQSIYSFQGARPERFSHEREETARRGTAVQQTFHPVRLPLSFRSTADVLAAVDQVFSLPENAAGLSAENEPVEHRSKPPRPAGNGGSVGYGRRRAGGDEEDWTAPFDALRRKRPARHRRAPDRSAHRDDDRHGKRVIEKGVERFIEAGDILVLVRKRHAFVNALTRELKQRKDIPVAGADRLRLNTTTLPFKIFWRLDASCFSHRMIFRSPPC